MTASVPGESNHEVTKHEVVPRGVVPRAVDPQSIKGAFPRSARLLRHADFERVYKLGRRHFSATMTVFYWPRPEVGVGEAKTSSARWSEGELCAFDPNVRNWSPGRLD